MFRVYHQCESLDDCLMFPTQNPVCGSCIPKSIAAKTCEQQVSSLQNHAPNIFILNYCICTELWPLMEHKK